MRDEKEGRKKQARSNKQQGKATQQPKTVTFPKKNELPRVGLEPTTRVHVCKKTICVNQRCCRVLTSRVDAGVNKGAEEEICCHEEKEQTHVDGGNKRDDQ